MEGRGRKDDCLGCVTMDTTSWAIGSSKHDDMNLHTVSPSNANPHTMRYCHVREPAEGEPARQGSPSNPPLTTAHLHMAAFHATTQRLASYVHPALPRRTRASLPVDGSEGVPRVLAASSRETVWGQRRVEGTDTLYTNGALHAQSCTGVGPSCIVLELALPGVPLRPRRVMDRQVPTAQVQPQHC